MFDYRSIDRPWFGWLVGWIDEYCMRCERATSCFFEVRWRTYVMCFIGHIFIINKGGIQESTNKHTYALL